MFYVNGRQRHSDSKDHVEIDGEKYKITWSEMDIKQSESRLHRPKANVEVEHVRKTRDKRADKKAQP